MAREDGKHLGPATQGQGKATWTGGMTDLQDDWLARTRCSRTGTSLNTHDIAAKTPSGFKQSSSKIITATKDAVSQAVIDLRSM